MPRRWSARTPREYGFRANQQPRCMSCGATVYTPMRYDTLGEVAFCVGCLWQGTLDEFSELYDDIGVGD